YQNRVQHGSMLFGPYIGELGLLHEKLCVVRGMSMETLDHAAGKARFLTGRPPSGFLPRGSSAGTWLSAHLGAGDPIAQLSVGVDGYNVDQPSWATVMRVDAAPDLLNTLSRTHATPDALNAQRINLLE